MARRSSGSGGGGGGGGFAGGSGVMGPIISVMVGLLVCVIIQVFAPTIGGMIEKAQPALGPESDWNVSHNPDLPSAAETWTTNVRIIGVVIMIIIISIGMIYLR